MSYDQRYAQSEVKMNFSFSDDGTASLSSHNGNAEHVSEVDLPTKPWLGRMRARLEFARRCRSGESEIDVQTMRPELGPAVIELTSRFIGLAQHWDGERMVSASEWSVKYLLPLPGGGVSDNAVSMIEAYPLEGPHRCYRLLQLGLDMPFGFLLATLSTKAAALKAIESDPSRQLPELVAAMNVVLDEPIARSSAGAARHLLLAVSIRGNKGKLELPTSGYQRVSQLGRGKDASKLLVGVDLSRPAAATDEELGNDEHLSSSAMIDSTDAKVIELAHSIDARIEEMRKQGRLAEATEGGGEPKQSKPLLPVLKAVALDSPVSLQQAIALRLRDLVHMHITDKNYETTYASASETARTGSGDCSEHAVLLTALLRARRIPSRVCHGLVYLEQRTRTPPGTVQAEVGAQGSVGDHHSEHTTTVGQFGWHMWSQALIDGHWYDLDATLREPYTVGHVLVGTSTMSDKEAQNSHTQMAALVGNLAITVQEVGHEWGPAA